MRTAVFLKFDKTTSQDLSAAALSYTTAFARAFKLEQIAFHFSVAVTETITITLMSNNGTNYNTVLNSTALISETDFVWRPQGEANFQKGDEIKVQCTAASLTGIVYVSIKSSEM